jgi:hypothetical protein
MRYYRNRYAHRAIRKGQSIDHKNSDRHKFSEVFKHTCKACAIYLMLWAIAPLLLLIGLVFECFPAMSSLVLFLTPSLIRLGCILFVWAIVVITYEGLR